MFSSGLPLSLAREQNTSLPSGEKRALLSNIEAGILRTVSYSDVFDFPLTLQEIHRNLIGAAGALGEVQVALKRLVPDWLEQRQEFYALPGRQHLFAARQRRAESSEALWPRAIQHGRSIAQCPFVRMVAVTGALAVNNARENDDIDYLIITEPGRLWVSRSFVILLVRRAGRRGHLICPNYLLTTRALALPERDIFTAHELMQMVPIFGQTMYRQMIALNSWAGDYLPNAYAHRNAQCQVDAASSRTKRILEIALRTNAGDRLERWEMMRKIRKFSRQAPMAAEQRPEDNRSSGPAALAEVSFSADRCKGHFSHHGKQALDAYNANVTNLVKGA